MWRQVFWESLSRDECHEQVFMPQFHYWKNSEKACPGGTAHLLQRSWERSLKLNRIFGGQEVKEAKSLELRVCLGKGKWPAPQFIEQRMLLLFLWAKIGAVNLFAEETTLESSWVQTNAIEANAWLELFLDHLYFFSFLPAPFSFPFIYHGFLKIVWVGETILLSFEFMLFITVCY